MAKNITCPACNYTRRPEDSDSVPDWHCPMCQRAYNKSGRTEPQQELSAPAQSSTSYIQVSVKGDDFLEHASQILFNGSQDVDPLAMRTSWSPVIIGYGLDHRELVEVTAERVEFHRPKNDRKWIVFLIILISMFLLFTIVKMGITSKECLHIFGIDLLLIVVSTMILYQSSKLVVFDRRQGCFWKGRMSGGKTPIIYSDQDFDHLEDIHALQLIHWQESGSNSSNRARIELNIVKRDCSRVNVSVYNSRTGFLSVNYTVDAKPREDAMALGRFLGKPVWDAIDCTKHYWTKERRWLDIDPVAKTSAETVETVR